MECDPVDTTVVALKDELDDSICVAKHVGLILIRACHLVFERHCLWGRVLLPQARYIPDTDRLIERGGDDEILFGMELRAHGVVVVAGHCTYFATLGRSRCVLRIDLLKEPRIVSLGQCSAQRITYDSASSKYE